MLCCFCRLVGGTYTLIRTQRQGLAVSHQSTPDLVSRSSDKLTRRLRRAGPPHSGRAPQTFCVPAALRVPNAAIRVTLCSCPNDHIWKAPCFADRSVVVEYRSFGRRESAASCASIGAQAALRRSPHQPENRTESPMGIILFIAFLAVVGWIAYLRMKRAQTQMVGQKFEWSPSNALTILGVLMLIPGFWILRVVGWTETRTTDLVTGETTTESTFGTQFAKALVFFVIGAALIFAAKVMAKKQTGWPPAVRREMDRLGLTPPRSGAQYPHSPSSAVAQSQGSSRFNSPPGWPVPPPGWTPSPDWSPDASWPPAPPGWQFWSTDNQPAD